MTKIFINLVLNDNKNLKLHYVEIIYLNNLLSSKINCLLLLLSEQTVEFLLDGTILIIVTQPFETK